MKKIIKTEEKYIAKPQLIKKEVVKYATDISNGLLLL